VIQSLESRQLLSFDPTSLVASGATNAAIAHLSHPDANVSPPPTVHPQPTLSGIRLYSLAPQASLARPTSPTGIETAPLASNLKSNPAATELRSRGAGVAPSSFTANSYEGTGAITGAGVGSTSASGSVSTSTTGSSSVWASYTYGENGYYSWTSESSGYTETITSGDDGAGGSFTLDEKRTWDDIWTYDSLGNRSDSHHSTGTYQINDSGTDSNGDNFNNEAQYTSDSDSSSYGHADGTSHSQSNATEDASESQHSENGPDTSDSTGTYNSTAVSTSDGSPSGSTSSSSFDSKSSSTDTMHSEEGSSKEDDTATASDTYHTDSSSSSSNGVTTSSSNGSDDESGSDGGKSSLGDGSNSDTSSYTDEYKGHSEWHNSNGSTSSSWNSSDDGNKSEDVSLYDGGNSETYGSSSKYSDTMTGSIDATGAYSGSYTHDDSGSDYQTVSVNSGGDTTTENYNDQYSNHSSGTTNPDGTSTSSFTSSGNGGGGGSVNLAYGGDGANMSGHEKYTFTASGGVNADGTGYGTYTADDSGGSNDTLHLADTIGDTVNDTESDNYDIQDNNGVLTVNEQNQWYMTGSTVGGSSTSGGSSGFQANGAAPGAAGADADSGFFGSLLSSVGSIKDGLLASGNSVLSYVVDTGWNPNWEDIYNRGPLGQTNTPNTPGWVYYGTRGAIGVSVGATALAGAAIGAEALGAAQFTAVVGRGSPFHVIYKVGQGSEWLHASGQTLGRLRVTSAGARTVNGVMEKVYTAFTGPVLFSGAASQTGQRALTCLSGAMHSYLKGWLPFIP